MSELMMSKTNTSSEEISFLEMNVNYPDNRREYANQAY